MNLKDKLTPALLLKYAKKSLPVLAGAAIGYAYYYFIGCRTGACPIQSNPWISTMYGAMIGASFLIPSKKKEAKKEEPTA